ncbi:MAG: hypothetical protein GXX96_20645 [Planctomycetaceae bacterium]|nr:hypothetical protein [Planctomycetaceae bacterium]
MKRMLLLCVLAAGLWQPVILRAESPCPIVPPPKVYRDLGRQLTLDTSAAVIVVGTAATEPEHYAAEYLQTQIERRFKHKLPICDETKVPETAVQVLLLGQVDTNMWLGRLCKAHKIDLTCDSPGHDGFVIECLHDGPRQIVLIGGCNPRAVVYGQNAWFDLLRQEGEKVVFPAVTVRDWPSIPWRGRPHSVLKQHLVSGALDAYLRARLNFTDVRDDPDVEPTVIFPARKASMGFPAGKPIDRPLVEQMIRESHRRGLFVYGTVSCGVPAEKTDDVIKTFEELIALGVDGLWISFDDVGAGENAANVVRRVLELGKRYDMTDRKIAITPPSGDYQNIDTPFNHQAAGQWGLEEAQWMFTRVPCADDLQMAREIGISGLPGWWHNLVNMPGGFLHNGDVLCPLRKDWGPAYVNPQPLANGWHHPSYEQLRDAEKHTGCVLVWGIIGGWPQEYQLGDLGAWAWAPAAYDWQRTCDGAYRLLYGPQQVGSARAFDAKLAELKDLFHLPPWRFWAEGDRPFVGWPCRLKKVEDRPKALALLDQLDSLAAALRREAPAQTAIDATRLKTIYLDPMVDTLDYGRRMTLLDYPEYTAADLEQTMISLLEAGKPEEAQRHLAEAGDRIGPQLDRIEKELADLKQIEEYVAQWRQRISGLEYWQKLVVRRRANMSRRFQKLLHGDAASLFPYMEQVGDDQLESLFARLPDPPSGKVLAELGAADWLKTPARFQGEFCVGEFKSKAGGLVAIAYPRGVPSEPGDGGEVFAEVAVPDHAGRLVLDAFVNDTRLEKRYPGFRFMQLWANDRLIWEEDIAPTRAGKEWVSLDVTEPAGVDSRLRLRFCVVDKRGVGDHLSVAFLGPVRLRAVEGAKAATQ